MKLYSQLSKISFLKNRYVAKFLFVAFVGIHIPLIGLVFFVVYLEHKISPMNIFLIALGLTLLAAAVTLFVLKQLISPVLIGSKALVDYRTNRKVPRLPLDYTDEAGVMLQNIQSTIQMNQKFVAEKREQFQHLTTDIRKQTEKSTLMLQAILSEGDTILSRKLMQNAINTNDAQLRFVDAFTEMMKEEALINAEQVKIRKLNMESFFGELKRKSSTKLAKKNIDFNLAIPVSDVKLKVNEKLLEKAYQYLLENAIRYASDNSKIEVSIEKVQGRMLIYFSHQGLGFESGQCETIFMKFNPDTDEKEEYVPGVGLYLTRKIIERFSGSITAESNGPDKGVTFTVELQLYR